MDGFLEVLQPLLLDANLMYLLFIAAAWGGVLALFLPGTGIAEFLSASGLLLGLAGLLYGGANVAGLIVLAVSFALYALALLRQFPVRAPWLLPGWAGASWGLALAATAVQFIGGVLLSLSMEPLSLWTVLVLAPGSLAIYRWVLTPAIRVLRRPPQAGVETLIGSRGEVRFAPEAPGRVGSAYLNGELWQIVAEEPLKVGDIVEVTAREGMRLHVRKVAASEE